MTGGGGAAIAETGMTSTTKITIDGIAIGRRTGTEKRKRNGIAPKRGITVIDIPRRTKTKMTNRDSGPRSTTASATTTTTGPTETAIEAGWLSREIQRDGYFYWLIAATTQRFTTRYDVCWIISTFLSSNVLVEFVMENEGILCGGKNKFERLSYIQGIYDSMYRTCQLGCIWINFLLEYTMRLPRSPS